MCPNKVQANCSDSDTGSLCMIQPCMYQPLLVNYVYCTYIMQLQIMNVIMTVAHQQHCQHPVHLCQWYLCPSLWGPAQVTVACRQLNPGRTVISELSVMESACVDKILIKHKLPQNIVILLGSGFAIADGAEVSGLVNLYIGLLII